MKRLLVLSLLVLCASPASAQVPLPMVRILNTSENVLAFPVTSILTEAQFRPNNLHLRFDRQGLWPPIDIGGALQEATLWVIAFIDGEWVGAGMERLRPAQGDKPEPPDPADFISDWVSQRNFGPFNGHVFQPGDPMGLLVVAGQSRLGGDFIVRERTDVVGCLFPCSGPILWREGMALPGPPPPPNFRVVP